MTYRDEPTITERFERGELSLDGGHGIARRYEGEGGSLSPVNGQDEPYRRPPLPPAERERLADGLEAYKRMREDPGVRAATEAAQAPLEVSSLDEFVRAYAPRVDVEAAYASVHEAFVDPTVELRAAGPVPPVFVAVPRPPADVYLYHRDWRKGDPPEARGRSLWMDDDGDGDVWLHPTEVRALGLVDAMREALAARADPAIPLSTEPVFARAQERVKQATRSRDARVPSPDDDSATSADEYWDDDMDRAGQSIGPSLADDLKDLHDAAVDADPLARPGVAAGHRWWVVEDVGGALLVYDNRPAIEAWDRDLPRSVARDVAIGPRPALVQAALPMAVVRAAAVASAGGDPSFVPLSERTRMTALEDATARLLDAVLEIEACVARRRHAEDRP